MRFLAFTFLLSLSLGLIGCGASQTAQKAPTTEPVASSEKPAGGVAVIDLDSIASRLGHTAEINQAIAKKKNYLNRQLAIRQKEYEDDYDRLKELYGEKPTEKETEKLKSTDRQLGIQLTEAQRNAQNELADYRQSLVNSFREEVRPVAKSVASERGFTIVITRDQHTMLSVDTSADITEAVIANLSSRPRTPISGNTSSADDTTPKVSKLPRGGEFK